MNVTKLLSWCGAWVLAAQLTAQAQSPAPSPINSEFFKVLRSGDARLLRAALDRGTPVNAHDAQGNTPLMLAAVYGDAACVRLLLDHGAEVNVTNHTGATALMRAAQNYDKVRLLVERGAEVNTRSAFGNTALMLAARPANSHRTVAFLLSRGAEASATNHWGATALMAAVAAEDAVSVRQLVRQGADINAIPTLDDPGFIIGGGRSALMWAAYRGHTDILRELLQSGADVNRESYLGTPLSQAAWADRTEAARTLLTHGAAVDQKSNGDSFAALHWAASTESSDPTLVKLLLQHGANPNIEGGENLDAFMDIPQTPLMLAKRRGDSPVLTTLIRSGATNETPDEIKDRRPPAGPLPLRLDGATLRSAVSQALVPLQESSIRSKQAFVNHESRQDCTSCHQQYMPLAALGMAKQIAANVDENRERELVAMVRDGEVKDREIDWQPLFHPDAAFTKGYTLFGYALAGLPADELTDASVHHLAAIQGRDGRWFANLPRPPIQNGDVGATALGIHALRKYPLPGRKAEFAGRVDRARRWLWTVQPANHDESAFQLLGLAWAGESPQRLESLARKLLAQQRADGGWSQLAGNQSDAYATGQAVYALHVGAGFPVQDAALDRARRYLLQTQLEDGTWHVRRRAFPFQPTTMKSGFPHGKDSWISATATSWAVLALSISEESTQLTNRKTQKLAGY
ncbi:MAG: ankyrin repeat domain-containing protein [Verrucomicrobiae bacterium]|nr:ankyrin repeat domain-containing protein [Verrucomicrobiae bacterium]